MSMYLFCFLKPDKRSPSVNQKRSIEVCRKMGCGYLDEGREIPVCTCEPSVEYFLSFKDRKKKLKKQEEVENVNEDETNGVVA